ncbi:NRDE family protein [Legionella maioricensis]|uniref:NRDE family protein n=1 Tax=Legionella maioricensis TaxID=2896528 RepID=A0A9X2D396_9GAMM|nr:NRDE family protein [Legionella maioricensis]MCL9685260.1 NRDE family protein [Legionella maioricensis]MCL9688477.1 NRDE family protein [Legionella maioricensis]
MCLALIAIDQHPLYPLIILSNRDEFYKRATVPAHYWQENPNIFSGKDLVGGGTWLGVNKSGHFSLITNYRNPNLYDLLMQSRGLLAKNFLFESIHTTPSAYVKKIARVSNNYNPFNLVVGNKAAITYYSNVINKTKKLTRNLYGISNHLLDTPWYKVLRAKDLFNKLRDELITCEAPDAIEKRLFSILEDKTLAPDNLLPNTGVSVELEKSLSSIFVNIPNQAYGTRSSTIILFAKNNLFFSEKTFINAQLTSLERTNIKME